MVQQWFTINGLTTIHNHGLIIAEYIKSFTNQQRIKIMIVQLMVNQWSACGFDECFKTWLSNVKDIVLACFSNVCDIG